MHFRIYFLHSPYHVKITLKVFLIVCTLWHDMVQGTIITSYCLQGQLLLAHLYFLRGKLLHHTLPSIDWMRVRDRHPTFAYIPRYIITYYSAPLNNQGTRLATFFTLSRNFVGDIRVQKTVEIFQRRTGPGRVHIYNCKSIVGCRRYGLAAALRRQ